MKFELTKSDIVVKDPIFLQLGMDDEAHALRLNRGNAMDILKEKPDLAAKLLSLGQGTLLWSGEFATTQSQGRTYGVRINNRKEVAEAEGDNTFGRFLMDVRESYLEYLRESELEDVPVRKDQIVTDFVPVGAYRSRIETLEQDEKMRFIHTDPYQAVRFRFDAGRDGTTGHSSRQSADDVPFHKFDCPFGTSYPYPILVDTAAEASMLYEQALRGELDWEALFRNLSDRGLLDRKMSARQRESAIADFRGQFAWMRDEICNNPELKRLPIVAGSMLVPDGSLGRSVYDADKAPSPAHVLARYINNPQLLFYPAQNGVIRSLGLESKDDPQRFSIEPGTDTVRILVVGSDVIGGRQPGRKATARRRLETFEDEDGNKAMRSSKEYVIPTKSREEVDLDYEKFAARLDDILSTIPEGTKVELVSGSASTLGEGIGLGTPRLVERYVREHRGMSYDYKFETGDLTPRENKTTAKVTNENLSSVLVTDFGACYPVLVGAEDSATFRDSKGLHQISSGALDADAVICFSSTDDRNNRNLFSLASFAASEGLPVIHVMDNRTREEQESVLAAGALLSRTAFLGNGAQGEVSLLAEGREQWDMDKSNVLAFVDPESQLAIPIVLNVNQAAVPVGGASFHTVMGTYAALMAQSLGENGRSVYASIAAAENSNVEVLRQYHSLVEGKDIALETKERCMRQAVRMMMGADSSFADRILSLDDGEIVLPNSVTDRDLFVDLDGRGRNGFGVVLAAERDAVKAVREARRLEAEEERKELLAETIRRQKISETTRAEGEKVREGLPANAEEAKGAVWFVGTNNPPSLALPKDGTSFSTWDDLGGQDPLNRESAASPTVSDGDGGHLDNRFIFLFASSQRSVIKGTPVSYKPDSRDLTGLLRSDPATGEKYPCAFGVPVKMNNNFDELDNDDHFPCSFRLDNDSSNFLAGVVIADTAARTEAFRRDMELCILGREKSNGTTYYPMTQFFRDKVYVPVYSFQLTDRNAARRCDDYLVSGKPDAKLIQKKHEVGVYTYSSQDSSALNEMIKNAGVNVKVVRSNELRENPHAAPVNLSILERYLNILENGKNLPLNCIPLASKTGYDFKEDSQVSREYAERRFVADLMMSLNIANSMALQLGVPLRFPLDKDGRIDLGPNIPEEFRTLAERRIDSFIGVVNEKDIMQGPLPIIERIGLIQAAKSSDVMQKSGQDFYARPNDLVYAFGAYDFSAITSGQTAPLHEMAFRTEDGTIFKLTDAKLTRGMTVGDINKYLSYDKNDERRFIVRSTNVEKVPEFLSALESYIERAKAIQVDVRLLREFEKGSENLGMEGYINLLSSNSDEFAESEHDIGREADALNLPNRFDGTDVESSYYGKVDAADGFRGYAQFQYVLPDGTKSEWETIKDLELAGGIVLSMVNRKYRSDQKEGLSWKVIDMLVKSEAVSDAGEKFRTLEFKSQKAAEVDSKVVSVGTGAPAGTDAPAKVVEPTVEKVNVFAGTGENAILSNFALRPFSFKSEKTGRIEFESVEQGFQYMKTYHSSAPEKDLENIRAAILSTTKGEELRRIGRNIPDLDRASWDAASEGYMRTMITSSFNLGRNPDACRALLATGDAEITHTQDKSRWGVEFPAILMDVRNSLRERQAMAEEVEKKDSGPKVYVSYYGSRSIPEDAFTVQISTSKPKGMEVDVEFEMVYPDYKTMVAPHRDGSIDDAEYTRRYKEAVLDPKKDRILEAVGRMKEMAEDRDIYLMCYEKPGAFCHRYLVSNFLNENGIACEENPADRKTYRQGHVQLINEAPVEAEPTLFTPVEDRTKPVMFTESSGSYAQRTRENAQANDVDFTVGFAVDFTTAGERCTAKAAGDSLIPVDIPLKKDGGVDMSSRAVTKAATAILNVLPEEFVNGEACGLNIAGNGIYTLNRKGVDQAQADEFVTRVLVTLRDKGVNISSIRSGGQTGIDEAGIAAAEAIGIPATVHAPRGWIYRGTDNVDMRGEAAFKKRFEEKDLTALKKIAETQVHRRSSKPKISI